MPESEHRQFVADQAQVVSADPVDAVPVHAESAGEDVAEERAPQVPNVPWLPRFATDDDLEGALDATTPLLARAFRNARPGESGPGPVTTRET